MSATLGLTLLSACGGPFRVVSSKPLVESGVAPKGILLFPVADMTPESNATEVAVRSVDVEGWLLEHTDVPLISPLDYTSMKAPDDMRISVSDSDILRRRSLQELNGWLALWVQITENRAANVRDYVDNRDKSKTKGKKIRKYGVEATVRVEVRALDAVTGRPYGQVVLKGKDNPSARLLAGDPRPTVTALVHKALSMLFPALDNEGQRGRRVSSERLLTSVALIERWSAPGLPSHQERNAKRDAFERRALRLALWRRVAPKISTRQSEAVASHPGLLVTQARAPLQVGDVVTSINGKRVTSRASLDRWLRVAAGKKSEATVWRAKTWHTLTLDWKSYRPVVAP